MSPGYACTECVVGVPLNREVVDVFVVNSANVVEYVDVADNQTRENVLQAVRISLAVFLGLGLSLVTKLLCRSGIYSRASYISPWSRPRMGSGDTS